MRDLSLLLSKRIFFAFIFIFPLSTGAHSDGQYFNGGYVTRSTGEYHCHISDCVPPIILGPAAGHLDVASFYIKFFDAMTAKRFDFILSEEGTGTNDKVHINSAATKWWIVFYKPDAVEPATDLPNGYLASEQSNHTEYERIPY